MRIIRRSLKLLTVRDKKVLGLIVVTQAILGVFDLIGVALVGIIGALSINGVQSREAGDRVGGVLSFLQIEGYEFQKQVAILGILATSFFVTRTLASVYFSRKSTFFLTRKSAFICGDLMGKLLSGDLLAVRKRSNQETLYAFSIGLISITVGILASAVNLVSDMSVLVLIVVGLFIVDFTVGLSTLILFASVGLLIYFLQQSRARKLGVEYSRLNVKSEEDIVEVLNSYREVSVHDRQLQYARRIKETRLSISDILAELNFMPQISKYIVESTVIVGALVVSGIQFALHDSARAIGILSIFIASGSRIAPAVMRIQQGLVVMKSSVGSAKPTLDLIDELAHVAVPSQIGKLPDFVYEGFVPDILLRNVTFTYPGKDEIAIMVETLEILGGQHVAIVGPSGAGKTTLVDLILGLIHPTSGEIKISGLPPVDAIKEWPGAISYVPQNVMITRGTLEENIALGYEFKDINQDRLQESIERTNLQSLFSQLGGDLRSNLGEMGSRISGGERQRIGIARSLYTNPKLLVMDEATSSLDAETEKSISDNLATRRLGITLITIAHRLSTVRAADLVVYIDKGKILATGSFQEVRTSIPDFDRQAKLMGL